LGLVIAGSGKSLPDISNFNFSLQVKKISSGRVKKYSGSKASWVKDELAGQMLGLGPRTGF